MHIRPYGTGREGEDRMKEGMRGWTLIRDLLAPLLIYMVVNDAVLYTGSAVCGGMRESWILPLGGLGAAVSSAVLGVRFFRKPGIRSAGVTPGDLVRIAPMGAGACIVLNNLLAALQIPDPGFARVQQRLADPPFPVQVLCTGLLIPFAEELVFRGYAYTRLRREMSVRGAVFASAVYFAIFHGNLTQGIYALILGCLLAVIYEWYGSLLAPWILHAAANLTSVMMTGLGLQAYLREKTVWMAGVTVAGGVILAGTAYKIREERRK